MDLEKEFNVQWVSTGEKNISSNVHRLDILEQELEDIKNNIEFIDEKRRVLTNLLKLY